MMDHLWDDNNKLNWKYMTQIQFFVHNDPKESGGK